MVRLSGISFESEPKRKLRAGAVPKAGTYVEGEGTRAGGGRGRGNGGGRAGRGGAAQGGRGSGTVWDAPGVIIPGR